MRFLALLRGINVGGNNIIPMVELRKLFEEIGFDDVVTYIQSGNVVFESKNSRSSKKLTEVIETHLAERFDYDAKVFVISSKEYFAQLDSAHDGFGDNELYKHNAMFVLSDQKPVDILKELNEPNDEIEIVSSASRTIFWSASQNSISKTSMMALSKTKLYKQLTVRNHKTTFKLAELLRS